MTDPRPLPARPEASAAVQDLLARMTLEEKLAQLVGYWLDHGDEVVAPMSDEFGHGEGGTLAEITEHGIGHYTRVYGTRPVEPAQRAAWLRAEQDRLRRETRLGIPALVHEETLTGLAAWQAATYPIPLAWGASFDPGLVEQVAAQIGADLRRLGVHQALAPVLDVIRDPRWGRTEEAIGEDPYLVGTIGTAYVRGLQSTGVHATLKHFLGYSGSRAGRNHAPVSAGPREVADVYAVPFEMALFDGGARSVMNSYADIDGVPAAADDTLLTGLLRERWGFDGTVVADYFSVAFLALTHGVAADRGEAAALALRAGIDVELPTGDAFLAPLAERVRDGRVPESLVDRAVLRVLSQKEALGLLDPAPDEPVTCAEAAADPIDLDSPRHRELARRLAEESVVLLANDGVLPLTGPRTSGRIAVIGPTSDQPHPMLGCYSFINHVLPHHPDTLLGIAVPTLAEAIRAELPEAELTVAAGCAVQSEDRSGFADAVAAAAAAELAVVAVGDQAGLFGRGTVGEGNDRASLELPGVQRDLVEAVIATGTPVVLIVISGRPYALGWALDGPDAPAAVLQAFLPGEEGGPALARVLSGAVNPSGRLPVSLPRSAGAQPYSYLQPLLGGPSEVTSADPTPVRPFGFGLSYTTFATGGLVVDPEVRAGGTFLASAAVSNLGPIRGADVVQLYGRDLVGSVVRPVSQLLGYARVELEPGESATVTFAVPTTRLAFTDRSLNRVVEPGDSEVWVAASAGEKVARVVAEGIADHSDVRPSGSDPDRGDIAVLRVTGELYPVTPADNRLTQVKIEHR